MDRQQVISEIKALAFPLGEYVVVGGASLAIRGLRTTEDIDLVVMPRLFERLVGAGWRRKPRPNGQPGLRFGRIEPYLDVNTADVSRDTAWLIAHAEIIDDIPLVDLGTLLAWKRSYGREKDMGDVAMLERILHDTVGASSVAQPGDGSTN